MSAGKENKNFGFGNHTDVGKVRSANEDYLGYFETVNGHIFVVCDGMGGHVGGATASQLAVESIRTFFEHATYEDLPEALNQSVLYANEQIIAYAQQNPHLKGMGTTCVAVIVKGEQVYYAHVGDSRLYYLHNNQLSRLTKDHSVVQQMVDSGMISEEEAENHPRKNEITQALGTMAHVDVAIGESTLHPAAGDILLLCTDGLNGMINDNLIRQVLAENISLQHKALKLVELANEAGGYDNITVQLIQFNHTTNNPIFAEDMTSGRVKKKNTKVSGTTTVPKGSLDPALITLCALFGIVIILLLMGSDQFSDNTISTSDLKLEQSVGTATDQETTEPEDESETEANTTEETSPAKATPPSAKVPEPVKNTAVKTPVQPASTSAGGETFITHTVRSGETFSAVARRYNVTNKTLQAWNPDVKDTDIKADATRLKVKVRATHTVGPGDVLDVVSKKYGVSKELIMAANGKTADRAARGETLVIPFAEKK